MGNDSKATSEGPKNGPVPLDARARKARKIIDLRKEWVRKAARGDCELWSVGRSVAEVRAQASRLTPDAEADEETRFYLEAARAEFERIASRHDEALAKARAANAETVVAMGDALVNAGFRRADAAILWASGMGLDELKRRLATDPSVFALERGLLKRHVAAGTGRDERGLLKRHVAAGTGIAR